MTNDNDIYIIEQYLDGSLNKKSEKEFKDRLKTDEKLNKLFKERERLSQVWNDAGDYKKVKKIVGEVMNSETSNNRSVKKPVLLVAASVVLLIGLAVFIYQKIYINNNESAKIAVNDSIITDSASFDLLSDFPANYAHMDSVKNSIELIFPYKDSFVKIDDEIVFRWKTGKKGVDTLCLKDANSGKILVLKEVELDKCRMKMLSNIPEGSYFWYFSSQQDSVFFTVK